MRFFCFHLMPWAHLPEDFAERYDSAWVTCPNTLYDPQLGHPLYNRYLGGCPRKNPSGLSNRSCRV